MDDPEAILLVNQPGSDGFKVDSMPLFQVALGREWYIHTVYTVRSKDNANRGIGKRSTEHQHHSLVRPGKPQATSKGRKKREIRSPPPLAWQIGAENNRGTNIQHIALDRSSRKLIPQGRVPPDGVLPRELNRPSSEVSLVTVVGGIAVGLLTLCLAAITVMMCKSKKGSRRKDALKCSGSSKPMMPPQSHHCDSSEVWWPQVVLSLLPKCLRKTVETQMLLETAENWGLPFQSYSEDLTVLMNNLGFELCLLFHASKKQMQTTDHSFPLAQKVADPGTQSHRWTARNGLLILDIFSTQWRQIYSKVLQTLSEV